MSPCANCDHPGEQHEWKIMRMRGQCRVPGCICSRYQRRDGGNWRISRVRFSEKLKRGGGAINPRIGRIGRK